MKWQKEYEGCRYFLQLANIKFCQHMQLLILFQDLPLMENSIARGGREESSSIAILQLRSDARKMLLIEVCDQCWICLHLMVHTWSFVTDIEVSDDLLREILGWMAEGASMMDVVTRLRQRTTPDGYPNKSWQPGSYSSDKFWSKSV